MELYLWISNSIRNNKNRSLIKVLKESRKTVQTLPISLTEWNAFAVDDYVVGSRQNKAYVYNDNILLEEIIPLSISVGSGMGRSCASNDNFGISGQWGNYTALFEF